MADTHKDKLRGKYKRAQKAHSKKFDKVLKRCYRLDQTTEEFYAAWYWAKRYTDPDPWDTLSSVEQKTIVNYRKNPSWYNHMFHTCRARAIERNILKVVQINDDNFCDDVKMYCYNKPMSYYW